VMIACASDEKQQNKRVAPPSLASSLSRYLVRVERLL
jgi:hypothetical protein